MNDVYLYPFAFQIDPETWHDNQCGLNHYYEGTIPFIEKSFAGNVSNHGTENWMILSATGSPNFKKSQSILVLHLDLIV